MRWKVTVAYDGHRYKGFQKQINGLGIQSVIEKALSKIVREPVSITAAGRTDAGVHAWGQVFHFDGPASITARGYYQALNTILPKDIRIRLVEEVDSDFHARFSAASKHYEYVLTTQRDNPFIEPYKMVTWNRPDPELMRQGAKVLVGTHDFSTFCCAQIDERKPRTKTIMRIDIFEEGEDIRLCFVGNGFLRYQVRMMSAALIALGQKKMTVDELQAKLEARDKHAFRLNAPAQGLYLIEVGYNLPDQERDRFPLAEKGRKK